jgi:hypothetical protein
VSRRDGLPWLKLLGGAAFALLAVVAVTMSINRYRAPASAPREALERIAEKNREAAAVAAASQRAESAAAADAAEGMVNAQQRGAAEANASLDRFRNDDNRSAPAGNSS